MDMKLWERKDVRFWLICLLSLILSQIGLVFLVYLVPLHLVYRRWGADKFWIAAGAVTFGVIIISLFLFRGVEPLEVKRLYLSLEIGMRFIFLFGLGLMLDSRILRMPGVYRFLIASAVIGITGVVIFRGFFDNDQLTALLENEFSRMGQVFQAGNEIEGGYDDALISDFFSGPEMMEMVKSIFLSSYAAWFSALLLFFWRVGEGINALVRREAPARLRDFRVPKELLWPVLIGWFLVILQLLVPLGTVSYIIWNAALILSLLYSLQGIGIIQTLMDRFRFPRGLRFLTGVILVSLLVQPGPNVAVMVIVPALGISETWIRFRNN